MRAVDTSVVLHALLRSHPWSDTARTLLATLAEGREPWALPWPCVYEVLRLATHPGVLDPPMPIARVRSDLDALLASPTVQLLSETDRHHEVLGTLLDRAPVAGNHLESARIAALCIEHGVREILSADVDLARFAGLVVTNPFREIGLAAGRKDRRGASAASGPDKTR